MSRQPSAPGTSSAAEPPAPHREKSGGNVINIEIISPSRADIEEVARRICIARGINPDADVHYEHYLGGIREIHGRQWRRFAADAESALIAAMFLQAKARS